MENKPESDVSNRFYFEGPLSLGPVTLDGPEAHHLAHVRRFEPGDAVVLFNGDGSEYPARVLEVARKRALLEVTAIERVSRELGFTLHLACALPKGDRQDFLVEKLTELGVTDWTPLHTERSIVRIDEARCLKFERAVIEASKQCGRNMMMRVHPPATWAEWGPDQQGTRLLADPGGSRTVLSRDTGPVLVAIGPEGGFTEREIRLGLEAGWESFRLGDRVLRTETAAIAAAALIGLSGNRG